MWSKAWSELRRDVGSLAVDEAHAKRERYQRASIEIRRMVAQGRVIAYRNFKHESVGNEKFDICYITVWHQEDYEDFGRYMAFRIYYSYSNCDTNKIGYRKYKTAEVCCYYDGKEPDPGASFLSEEEARDYTRKKEGYHVI